MGGGYHLGSGKRLKVSNDSETSEEAPGRYVQHLTELVFNVSQEEDGGFVAECLQEPIFTQGDTWGELSDAVRDAVAAWHFDLPAPSRIRLHLVRDEVLTLA